MDPIIDYAELLALGETTVYFQPIMLEDVYIQENEPVPDEEDFRTGWLTRQNEEKFWVYRRGFIPFHARNYPLLVAVVKRDQLTAAQMSSEGYFHVPEISLRLIPEDPTDSRRPSLTEMWRWISEGANR